jgi:Ca-activated chloride channel family protein
MRGDSEQAAGLFEDPAWAGTAAYEAGDYDTAAQDFARGSDADSWYNRGNALARAGKIDEAIAAYEESLELAPDRSDAMENIALLEQIKDQQQNQDQGQQDQEQRDQQNEQQDQEQQGGQQEQQQGQQTDQEQDQQQQQSQQQQEQGQQEEQEQEQQQQDQQEAGEQQENAARPDEEQPGEQPEEQAEQRAEAQLDPEAAERDQAMEQWLRRVPDDPSGLLRQKFLYESRRRAQRGEQTNNDTYW